MSVGIATVSLHKWSVADYHRFIELGILTEDDRVELLEGNVVNKMPPNPPHSNTVSNVHEVLGANLPSGWRLRSENPITLVDSEPEPDFVFARGDRSTYRTRHPGPDDIGLVVEVSDTSLAIDRAEKGRIYARSNLPIYWIINVVDRQVEVYSDPRPNDPVPSYATRTDYGSGDAVPLVLDGQLVAQLPVDDLLG
jgi:Uma2 family endonuclease